MDRFVGKAGITGWYYRVLETGSLQIGDPVGLVERPRQSVSIHDLVSEIFSENPNIDLLKKYSALDTLDDEWKEKCLRKAASASKAK